MKTIGIIGSRRRNSNDDYKKCLDAFEMIYKPGDRLVSGGCPKGGDRFAENIARAKGLTITIHYPKWENDEGGVDKSAGFQRNTRIAEDADVLLAVVAEDRTGGTEDTIKKFEKLPGKQRLVII